MRFVPTQGKVQHNIVKCDQGSGLCETLPSSFVPRFKTAFQRVERFSAFQNVRLKN